MLSYPFPARQQRQISKDLDYWTDVADVVIPGFMGFDGVGRWDVLTPSPLVVDLDFWARSKQEVLSDSGEVVIAHAPNHRGFKGSEFVIQAVASLRLEGLNVRLLLLEGMTLRQVRKALLTEADILVEQVLFFGHGLNGLEGMASSLPVVSNLDSESRRVLDNYTFFGECPIVSARKDTLVDVLRELVLDANKRTELGAQGRLYIEKWHSNQNAVFLFSAVLRYLSGDNFALKNLYHPYRGSIPPEKR
jgi:hypothetical protein